MYECIFDMSKMEFDFSFLIVFISLLLCFVILKSIYKFNPNLIKIIAIPKFVVNIGFVFSLCLIVLTFTVFIYEQITFRSALEKKNYSLFTGRIKNINWESKNLTITLTNGKGTFLFPILYSNENMVYSIINRSKYIRLFYKNSKILKIEVKDDS